MRKILSTLSLLLILTNLSACTQEELLSAETTVNTYIDNTTSTNASEENEVIVFTTQGYSSTDVKSSVTTGNSEIISEAFSPAYDPGMPEFFLRLDTTDIYNDTKNLSVTLLCENELITDNSIYIQKNNHGEWETYRKNYGAYSFFDNISVDKDNPLTINIDVADFFTQQNSEYNNLVLEARKEYRIMKEINGTEYYSYFTVGAHIPKLKQDDIEISLGVPDNLKGGDSRNIKINYKYVGNAEYADYGFGCEYTLEKLNDKGEWVNFPFSDNAAFISLGYNISTDYPTNSTTVSLNDDFYAEPLTAGTYRILKPIEDLTFTALFRINEYNYNPEPPKNEIELSAENHNIINNFTDKFTLKVKYTGDDDYAEFMYGNDYKIEKLENGKWVEFPFNKNVGFASIGHILNSENSSYTKAISINSEPYIYEKPFTEGNYRVVETISETAEFYYEFEYHNIEAIEEEFTGCPIDISLSIAGKNSFYKKDKVKEIVLNYQYIGNEETPERTIYSDFILHKLDENGKWQIVDFSENIGFDDYIIKINKDNLSATETITIFDDMFKKPLENGTYRIVKALCDCNDITAEFEIISE